MTAQACILVVDDDPALLEIVTTLLTEAGCDLLHGFLLGRPAGRRSG